MAVDGFEVRVKLVKGLPDAAVLEVAGPLDARTMGDFRARVEGLRARGMRRYVVGMAAVKYVNSTGISYLINLAESLGEATSAVTLVEMQPRTRILFETMGVYGFFKTAASYEAAVKGLRAETAVRERKTTARVVRSEEPPRTGRMSPPSEVQPAPVPGNAFTRFLGWLFGRKGGRR